MCCRSSRSRSAALAQAVVTGSVKDTSGAVLPGVSVEAASPVLIEKVRSSVTDGAGQYRIEDLRPGTYTVTFTLQGFNTFKREGVELTGSFTATINADLKVGTLAETVTVTGESPIVDVQSARRETTLNSDVIRSLPTVRNYNSMVVLVPGVVTNANDVATGPLINQFPIHGGRANESRLTIDGLNVGNPPGGNQPPTYVADVGNSQEVTFTTSGGSGRGRDRRPRDEHRAEDRRQQDTKGPSTSAAPASTCSRATSRRSCRPAGLAQRDADQQGLRPERRRGRADQEGQGLVLRQRAHAGQHADHGQSVLQPERGRPDQMALRAGPEPARLLRSHLGKRQRSRDLAGRRRATRSACSGTNSRSVESARERRRVSPRPLRSSHPRPTASVPRSRFACSRSTWSSPATNRLLFDAGFGDDVLRVGQLRARREPDARLWSACTEQCAGGCAANGGIPGSRLSLAGLERQLHGRLPVARIGVLRHGRAQPEDRAHGHVLQRRPHELHERPAAHVSGSTTACRIS